MLLNTHIHCSYYGCCARVVAHTNRTLNKKQQQQRNTQKNMDETKKYFLMFQSISKFHLESTRKYVCEQNRTLSIIVYFRNDIAMFRAENQCYFLFKLSFSFHSTTKKKCKNIFSCVYECVLCMPRKTVLKGVVDRRKTCDVFLFQLSLSHKLLLVFTCYSQNYKLEWYREQTHPQERATVRNSNYWRCYVYFF